MEPGHISYSERLKGIVDKEQSLTNGIITCNYQKVKNLLEKSSAILTSRHLELVEHISTKELSAQEKLNSAIIKTELNHYAEKNFAEAYATRNELSTFSPDEILKMELAVEPPSHKEPLIYSIGRGGNSQMLNSSNLGKKLHDLQMNEVGGRRILEKDKEILIRFAAVEAIKRDDVETFRHLDKEFSLADGVRNGLPSGKELAEYIRENNAYQISAHISSIQVGPKEKISESQQLAEDTRTENSRQNSLKLNALQKTRELISAMGEKNVVGIQRAILQGADHRLVDYKKHLKELDPADQQTLMQGIKQGIEERNKSIPEEEKYKFNFSETMELQKAAEKGDALKAYHSIKRGADPKGISESMYQHLGKEERKAFQNAIVKAFSENQKNSVNEQIKTGKGQPGI